MINLLDRVLETLITHTISPAVVRTGQIDDAIRVLKRSAVHVAVSATQQSKAVLARHFDKSDRWLYRMEEDARAAEQDRAQAAGRPLIYDVMEILFLAQPEPVSTTLLVDDLSQRRIVRDRSEIEAQLNIYVATGLIEAVETGDELGYRARSRFFEVREDGLEARLSRISRAADHIMPTAVAYARGAEGSRFGSITVNASPEEWAACVKDCHEFLHRRVHQAVERTLSADPFEEQREVFVLVFGAGPVDGHAPVQDQGDRHE